MQANNQLDYEAIMIDNPKVKAQLDSIYKPILPDMPPRANNNVFYNAIAPELILS